MIVRRKGRTNSFIKPLVNGNQRIIGNVCQWKSKSDPQNQGWIGVRRRGLGVGEVRPARLSASSGRNTAQAARRMQRATGAGCAAWARLRLLREKGGSSGFRVRRFGPSSKCQKANQNEAQRYSARLISPSARTRVFTVSRKFLEKFPGYAPQRAFWVQNLSCIKKTTRW